MLQMCGWAPGTLRLLVSSAAFVRKRPAPYEHDQAVALPQRAALRRFSHADSSLVAVARFVHHKIGLALNVPSKGPQRVVVLGSEVGGRFHGDLLRPCPGGGVPNPADSLDRLLASRLPLRIPTPSSSRSRPDTKLAGKTSGKKIPKEAVQPKFATSQTSRVCNTRRAAFLNFA